MQANTQSQGGQHSPAPPPPPGEAKVLVNERVVFTEEESPQQHIRLIAAGEMNEYLLDALEDFVKRQRKRLNVGTN